MLATLPKHQETGTYPETIIHINTITGVLLREIIQPRN